MLAIKQIENLLRPIVTKLGGMIETNDKHGDDYVGHHESIRGIREELLSLPVKIVALADDNGASVAAATLENEVTSTLVDMVAATVLATLIEEEGGGRSNISISPMSMNHMTKNYDMTVAHDGMIRNVSITMKEDSPLRDESTWGAPSNRHGVMHQDENPTGARPQAEPKEYNRPVWVVRVPDPVNPYLRECFNREDAERVLRGLADVSPLARIENRHCLHEVCPSDRCNVWLNSDNHPGNGQDPDGN